VSLDPTASRRVGDIGTPQPASPARAGTPTGGPSFGDVLGRAVEKTQPLRWSAHALQRIERRSIDVNGAVGERLEAGVQRAAAKGARDSLVLVDETAFVVSVRNRTVITAVDREHMKEQVFTNIDSAVIA
jgi:flagellar operon protein